MIQPHKNITGVILVGGKSLRMGQDKAFLKLSGRPLLDPVLDLFRSRFSRLLLAGDRAERFNGYGLPIVPDIYPGSSLGGVHAGLSAAETEKIFVAPCDLPFPNSALLDYLCGMAEACDVVVSVSPQGYEPLFALYSKSCLEPIHELLERKEFRIIDLFPMVITRFIQGDELASIAGIEKAFVNINTPEEYSHLTEVHASKAEGR